MSEKSYQDMTKEEKKEYINNEIKEELAEEQVWIDKNSDLKLLFDVSAVFVGTDHQHDWPEGYDYSIDEKNPCLGKSHEDILCLNMSDTFSYASSDGEDVKESEIEEIIDIYKKYGSTGLTCWAAKKRGYDPVIEYTEDQVYQDIWKAMYGDLKLDISPMLKDDPSYRWGSESQLHLKPWESIE